MRSKFKELLSSIEIDIKDVEVKNKILEKDNNILKRENQNLLSKIEILDKEIKKYKNSKRELTQERLKELLSYDPITGVFKRLKQINYKINPDKIVGSNCNGYLIVKLDNKFYRLHRLAWLYAHGRFPENDIDHIDGDKQNNKLENLREANTIENGRNKAKFKKNKSGHKGVCWIEKSQKWRASIALGDRKTKHIGLYENLEDAIEAFTLKAIELHGEFAHKEVRDNYEKILVKKFLEANI